MNSLLSTIWSDKITKIPLDEYPRPQLRRDNWTCLNGQWEYAVTDINEKFPSLYEGFITVPYAIESAKSGVCKSFLPNQRLHYMRKFKIERNFDKRLLLHFEAVDWKCDVYVNDKKAGSHTGGYIPFSFDITNFTVNGENTISLSVTDPTDTSWQQRGKQKLEPVSIWYTPTSGIWQTVWLEEVPKNYIKHLKITPSSDLDSVDIQVLTKTSVECNIKISDGDNTFASVNSVTNEICNIDIPNSRLWSPDDPFLYNVDITAGPDSIKSYFGMRSISLSEGPAGRDIVLLNGKPVFINGPLDQGYWPESGMTQPSDEAIVFDLQAMKNLNFNTIRKHIKIESRRWYYHADRLGLMVIQDMPNGGGEFAKYMQTVMAIAFNITTPDDNKTAYKASMRDTSESRNMYERELKEMLMHLHNHPSIVIWCPFNESWGQYDSKKIYHMVKEVDPSRLADHASGWFDQGSGDFRSIHTYKIKLKAPPKSDRRAYLISEYGGYNFIDTNHLWRNDDSFGYKYYKTAEELNFAYENLVNKQVLPLIEKGLIGVIYTQLSDVEIETNGIYTYDRKVLKFNPDSMKKTHESIQKAFEIFNNID